MDKPEKYSLVISPITEPDLVKISGGIFLHTNLTIEDSARIAKSAFDNKRVFLIFNEYTKDIAQTIAAQMTKFFKDEKISARCGYMSQSELAENRHTVRARTEKGGM